MGYLLYFCIRALKKLQIYISFVMKQNNYYCYSTYTIIAIFKDGKARMILGLLRPAIV